VIKNKTLDTFDYEEKLINFIMKHGKKSVAKKIYADTLKDIKASGHMNPTVVVRTAIENASPVTMIKSKRIGGAVYQVPVEVKADKRFFLAAYSNQGAAVKKKEEAHKMAEANKAFAYMAKYIN